MRIAALIVGMLPLIAQAEWNPPLATFQGLFTQMDNAVKPLERVYFHPENFEQDSLGTHLAVLREEIDENAHCVQCEDGEARKQPDRWVKTLFVSGGFPRTIELLQANPWNPSEVVYFNPYVLDYLRLTDKNFNPGATTGEMTDKLVEAYRSYLSPADQVAFRRSVFNGITYAKVLAAQTDHQWKTALAEARQSWTQEEKLQFVSHLGAVMGGNYDHDRAKLGTRASRGAVPMVQLMSGLRSGRKTGVCRDIASAQAEIMSELGFENVYVLGYGSSVPHATLIASDPSDPHKLVKLNYSTVTTSRDFLEINALKEQGDRGIAYQIYKAKGGLVSSSASELGQVLTHFSGGDIREIDVFSRLTAPALASLKAQNKDWTAQLFTGELTNGTRVVGVSGQRRWGNAQDEKIATEVGAAYAKQFGAEIDSHHLYGRVTQYVNSPWMKLNEAMRARVFSSAQIAADSSMTGWVLANAGIATEAKSADGKSTLEVKTGTQLSGGLRDIRDVGRVGMFHNLSYVSATASRRMGDQWTGLADLAFGYRQLGAQVMAAMGVKNDKAGTLIKGGYEGSLNAETPALAPGTARKFFAEGQTQLKGWTVRGEYSQPTDPVGRRNPTMRSSVSKSWGR